MRLEQLGWNLFFEQQSMPQGCIPGRVSEENRELYRVLSAEGEYLAEMRGRIRYEAADSTGFPAVGDWVVLGLRRAEARATIESILARRTSVSRKNPGKSTDRQILCANVDFVFVVTSLNQDFNPRRIERYMAIAWESGAQPVLILTKSDLCPDTAGLIAGAELIASGVPVHAVSATTKHGMEIFSLYLTMGRTGVFVGSSGVGKSTIINVLSGREMLKTAPVRDSDDRGRHTTTSRQMILLENDGVVIDTPGMRELGLWDSSGGITQTFRDLEAFAQACRFRDCTHRAEPGCAVLEAVQNGTLSRARWESYHKLRAELRFLEAKTSIAERLNRKAYWKRICKAQKQMYARRKQTS